MGGSKYDKFFLEEMVKEYPKQEQIELLFEKVRNIEAPDTDSFVVKFEGLINEKKEEAQRQKD